MHKKVIIVFWGHPLYDGRCMNMLNQLNEKTYQISILGVGSKKETFNYQGIQIELLDNKKLDNSITKYFKFFYYVKKFINRLKPDFIIASDLYSMVPIAQNTKKNQSKIIYDSRELYTQLAGLVNRPVIQKLWSWYEKKNISKVNCVLANAEIDQTYLHTLYPDVRIELIKNLPGKSFFKSKKMDLKKLLCLNEKQKIFIYQGKFHNGRGIRFAIKCMSSLKETVLVLIGDGPMKEEYINFAKKYKMEGRIFFIDAVPYEELANFSSSAYVGLSLIQPISKSYENALPNKLFEYAVSGIPIICSNLEAMNEMVSHYNCGIAISPSSENEFINAYQMICNNYDEYILDEVKQTDLLWNTQNKHLIDIINE